MSTEATVLFTAIALALAATMILASVRAARVKRAEALRARARAERVRVEAELARRRGEHWEHQLVAQREAILLGGDPRGLDDGMRRARPRRVTAAA